ncbi:MAG: dienelactone hydrolase [Pirellulaceae bacterium]|jgi:dienelactone hydrolase
MVNTMLRTLPPASLALLLLCSILTSSQPLGSSLLAQEPLAGTKPLKMEGDIASQLVDGVDKFLLRKLDESIEKRGSHWNRDFGSQALYMKSLEKNRERLRHIIGVRDARVSPVKVSLLATPDSPALVAESTLVKVYSVSWTAFDDVTAEGLLLVPTGKRKANIVAIPDADLSPEDIAGLTDKVAANSQYARVLAESGCRVLVPTLISRHRERRNDRANLTHREYLYRSAFELGRHLIGYEVQKILAAVDYFEQETSRPIDDGDRIGVVGWGEGGMLALYAGAIDQRIDSVLVSGHFESRQEIWRQPIDRNVFGLLEQFGDAELAAMVAPRCLVIEACLGVDLTIPGEGGAPARLTPPNIDDVKAEVKRIGSLVPADKLDWEAKFTNVGDGDGPMMQLEALTAACRTLGLDPKDLHQEKPNWKKGIKTVDATARMQSQLKQIDRFTQRLLVESPYTRKGFMKNLATTSLADYNESVEHYRDFFRNEVIGHFDDKVLPANARTRKVYDMPTWTGYEVVLDVYPDVIAFGILLIPKDIKPGEKRPVVVCQHGLEGRPRDTIEGDHRAYHDFAAKLAERGFITFAPQNLYIFQDRFRTLQREANPIKKSLFSVIVPQHQQIVDWLSDLPQVDSKRIAFYGLSYGGKSAMRIPPLVTDYCLSICSADFNEWVGKNASTRARHSYVWTGEYEIFEFDLGSTFNYAEMAALIAPRPFMVERGHYDGVGTDEDVAHEFAKVRHLYAAKLGIPDRCEIEWFYGPFKGVHTINGQGTFKFLHKHLNWPEPNEAP